MAECCGKATCSKVALCLVDGHFERARRTAADSTPTEREAGDVEEVLAEHQWHDRRGQTCGCGWNYVRGNGVMRFDQFVEHQAAALAPLIAAREQAAEQRGREDNADHGMCYVAGSEALAAREQAARAEALREAARRIEEAWGRRFDAGDTDPASPVRAAFVEVQQILRDLTDTGGGKRGG